MPDNPTRRHNTTVPDGYAPMMVSRRLRPEFSGQVHGIVGYRENGHCLHGALEMAPLVVPLIVSFGDPFEIALGRAPTPQDLYGSFTSGLFPGYVMINSNGRAECIQIDFTPLGAFRFFGLPMTEISNRMVTLDDLADAGVSELRARLGEETDWDRRFELVDAFLMKRLRLGSASSNAVDWAYRRIVSAHGGVRVGDIAAALGWSRKHLNERFREQVGIGPKAFTRMVRFNHALDLARQNPDTGWAAIAADSFYADQAHLIREFREFSGITPGELVAAA